MKETTRREFLRDAALTGAAIAACTLTERKLLAAAGPAIKPEAAAAIPRIVELAWLGREAPLAPCGVSWGVAWARGTMASGHAVTARSADGNAIPTQSWPLAYWPDGSLKWSGLAIATGPQITGPFTGAGGPTIAPVTPILVKQDAQTIEIATGPLRCRIARTGQNLI